MNEPTPDPTAAYAPETHDFARELAAEVDERPDLASAVRKAATGAGGYENVLVAVHRTPVVDYYEVVWSTKDDEERARLRLEVRDERTHWASLSVDESGRNVSRHVWDEFANVGGLPTYWTCVAATDESLDLLLGLGFEQDPVVPSQLYADRKDT